MIISILQMGKQLEVRHLLRIPQLIRRNWDSNAGVSDSKSSATYLFTSSF